MTVYLYLRIFMNMLFINKMYNALCGGDWLLFFHLIYLYILLSLVLSFFISKL
jgi:hypothetical protein